MLTCNPQSICSWNYAINGAPRGVAELRFDFFTETGSISYGGDYCEVRKSGFLSGEWTLLQGDERLAVAHKPNAFFRRFNISHGSSQVTLNAVSPLSRAYRIGVGELVLGYIEPVHVMTRRATMRCDPTVPIAVQLFAFWLVVITWRRAANNNN